MKRLNLLIGMLLALPSVSAQGQGLPIPDILDRAIRAIFGGIQSTVYQRLILFIGVFVIFYAVLQMSKVFGDGATKKSGISITLALVLSAIATFSMSETLINAIFDLYGGIFGIILLFGPALYIIYYVYQYIPAGTRGGHLTRFVILLIIAALFLSTSFISAIDILEKIGAIGYVEFAGFIVFIFAIIEMFRSFGSKGKGDVDKPSKPWGSTLTNYGSTLGNKTKNLGKKIAGDIEKESEDEEALDDVDKQEKEVEDKLEDDSKKVSDDAKNIKKDVDSLKEKVTPESINKLTKDIKIFRDHLKNTLSPKQLEDLFDKKLKLYYKVKQDIENGRQLLEARLNQVSSDKRANNIHDKIDQCDTAIKEINDIIYSAENEKSKITKLNNDYSQLQNIAIAISYYENKTKDELSKDNFDKNLVKQYYLELFKIVANIEEIAETYKQDVNKFREEHKNIEKVYKDFRLRRKTGLKQLQDLLKKK